MVEFENVEQKQPVYDLISNYFTMFFKTPRNMTTSMSHNYDIPFYGLVSKWNYKSDVIKYRILLGGYYVFHWKNNEKEKTLQEKIIFKTIEGYEVLGPNSNPMKFYVMVPPG
jgi:hypothetical protein